MIPFIDLTTFEMAMAITYYLSSGNLFIPAMIRGAYDAMGFLGIAVSPDVGILLRGTMISIGVIVASTLLIQRAVKKRSLLTS